MKNDIKQQLLHNNDFPTKIPLALANKIDRSNPQDPILLQFAASPLENLPSTNTCRDPLNEQEFSLTPQLIHKYSGRALLITSNHCPMNCRFCFRRWTPHITIDRSFAQELDIIRNTTSISEIILSGGDPLSLNNDAIEQLLSNLSEIHHIKRIRFHTRYPIGCPERIDNQLIAIIKKCTAQIIFVIHTNHPNELDAATFSHLSKIQQTGTPILSQTVLLKNINDNPTTLINLFSTLASHGIIPYYLHQLDPVTGASHFATTISKGQSLITAISQHLPGYATPNYVQDIPNNPSKTRLL